MAKNEVNNKKRVEQLRAGGAEDLKEFYTRKILAEEPDARIEVEYVSEEEMYAWKEGF